ncbi:MAG: carboxypeptidase regulatory-like domain-containing protein, partial [Candidatus Hydrogenedentes bacterium]|nr:carboxypeptidase regulatory-like domain-containing protein [Candidatus Hydrogenedentota bacterium]
PASNDARPSAASPAAPERVDREATPALVPTAATPAPTTGATVEGFVREQDTSRPLPGVYLVCQPDDGANSFRFGDDERVHTDAEGRYRIAGLSPGRYKLLCGSDWETRDPGDPQDYEVQLRFVRNESVRRFEITGADAQAGPEFEAIVGETVSGFVIDDGKPVADAVVMVHGSGTFVNVRTAENGWFKAGGFPVTDEVRVIAEKGRTRPGIRVEAIGEQQAIPPEPQTLVSGVAGPVTVTEGGLKNIRLELRPGASVAGVLTDDTGNPLADVNVMARSNAKLYIGSRFAKTGEQGEFVLSGMAEGEYDLAWNPRKPGEDEHMYGWTPHEALILKRIEVTWDQHLRGVQLRANTPGSEPGADAGWTLAGRVRDTRGNAVEGAVVRAWEMGHSGTAPQTTSAPDGRFELGDVNAGPLTMLRVEHPDFSTHMDSLPEPVERPMDIVLEDWGTVSGQVRYADTGMPVTAFSVRMQKGNNQPVFVENEEGRFRLEGADAGENEVIISAEGYKETGTPVTVLPGREVAGIDARLERGLAVEGSVVNERGAPVEGAFLFAKRIPKIAAERETQLLAKTDAEGRFRVESLKDEYGVLSAWHADFGMGAARYDTSASGVEIVLRNNQGTVSGQVLLDGLPAVGAEVNLMAANLLSPEAAAFGTPSQRVKEDGLFRFEDVPEGEYNVSTTIGKPTATAPMGDNNLSQKIFVEPGAETEVLLEFPVADASVEGRVLFQGKPVPQGFVVLTVESPEGKQMHMTQLDPDGAYVIAPVAAGTATLRTSVTTGSPFAGISQKLEFEIAPGDALIRDVEFNGQGTIRGTLSGAPADRQIPLMLVPASVNFSEPTLETVVAVSQESVANAMTTGSGPFEFTAIPPGEYAVLAWLSHPSGKFDGYATALCTVPEDGAPQTVTLHFQTP